MRRCSAIRNRPDEAHLGVEDPRRVDLEQASRARVLPRVEVRMAAPPPGSSSRPPHYGEVHGSATAAR
jgi:hypothetical protein